MAEGEFCMRRQVKTKKVDYVEHPVYLDYQATTPLDNRVLNEMLPYMQQNTPCNSHSRSHAYGWKAQDAIDMARSHVAETIHANVKDIIFTSGATESNNLAIKGVADFYGTKGKHIITVVTEHKCVLDTCKHLEAQGFEVTYLLVKEDGLIDINSLKDAIREDTILVSVMFVNNEIGVIQPIKEIGEICRSEDIFFHTDAAQAFGKIPIDVDEMKIDLLSISGHKIYAPMGIGALYVRRKNPRVRITPLINGGGQERGMRSGTLPTYLVVGLGSAAKIAYDNMEKENKRILTLRNRLLDGISAKIPLAVLNGSIEKRISGNLNISFPYIEGESLIMGVKELAVSSGSACTSASLESSYVLKSLGVDEIMAHSSIRMGIGRFTTEEEIDFAINLLHSQVDRLLNMSPLWEMVQQGVDLNSIKWDGH